MTVMLGDVYGVEQRSAATDGRLDRLESKVDKIDGRMVAVESKLAILQWMLGFLLAGVATVMAKLFV